MKGAENKFLFGISLLLMFQAITKSLKYVKLKLTPDQHLSHARSSIKDGEFDIR